MPEWGGVFCVFHFALRGLEQADLVLEKLLCEIKTPYISTLKIHL
jgi:hypothetical protein